MENYVLVLYVTLEQEQAVKRLFDQNDWFYNKPDVTAAMDIFTAALENLSQQSKLPGEFAVKEKSDILGDVATDLGQDVNSSGVKYCSDAAERLPELIVKALENQDGNCKLPIVNKACDEHNLGNQDDKNTVKIKEIQMKKKRLTKVKNKNSETIRVKHRGKDNGTRLKGESKTIQHENKVDKKNMEHTCKYKSANKMRHSRGKHGNGTRKQRNIPQNYGESENQQIHAVTRTGQSNVENGTDASSILGKKSSGNQDNRDNNQDNTEKTCENHMDKANAYEGLSDAMSMKCSSELEGEPLDNVTMEESGTNILASKEPGNKDDRTEIMHKNNGLKQELSCLKCRKKFKSLILYQKHKVIDRCQLICPHCGKNFRNRYTSFKRHLQFVHTKVNLATCTSIASTEDIPMVCSTEPGDTEKEKKAIIKCPDCHLTFEQKHVYEKHRSLRKCRSECPYCQKVFINNYHYFQMHIRRKHTKERPYVCSACGVAFVNISLLNIHEREHAGETFPCNVCGATFPKQAQMFSHRKVHSQQVPWLCDMCGSEFGNAARLRFHKARVHSEARPYCCPVCSRRFKDKYDLTKHAVIHSDVKKHKCTMCDKSFKLRQGLTIHERRHNQDFRHFCTHCSKGFIQKGRLAEHMRIHLNDKPFECSQCSYKCTSNSNLKKHINVHLRNRSGKHNQHRQSQVPKTQDIPNAGNSETYSTAEVQKLPDTSISYDQSENQKLSNYQLLMSDDLKVPLANYQMTEDAKVQQHYYLTLDDTTKIPEGYNLDVMPIQVHQNVPVNNATSNNLPITLTPMNVNEFSSYVKLPSMSMTGDDKQTHYVIPQHML